MSTTAVLIVAFFAVAAVDWVAVARGSKPLEYVAKPGALVVLIAAALALDAADDTARAVLVVALVLCLAGDVFLMLPGRAPGAEGPNLFLAGLASFLAGHVAYVAAFWIAGVEAAWVVAGAALAAAVVVAVGRPVVGAVARSAEPGMARPVAAYVGVISLMVLSATATGEALAIAGALIFATSDTLIARERFIAPVPAGRLAIITTYHVAQALLVLSFA